MTLQEIGKKYGTDKHDDIHSFKNLSYLDVYDKYFSNKRQKNIKILEIGILNGSSLKMWKEYFSNGQIYGIDINPKVKQFEEDRIIINICKQHDVNKLKEIFNNIKFDIIIDDGSHINEFTLASYNHLFYNNMSEYGIYVIEDLACSYDKLQTNHNIRETWPGMNLHDKNENLDNVRNDMDKFFLSKIKDMDFMKGELTSIQFWSRMCFMLK